MNLASWASAPQAIIVAIAAIVAVGSALMMVTRRDIVRGALWLVVTLIAVAVLYVTLSADLIGVVQVVVYAGAVVVLFLFVIVLLAAGKEPKSIAGAGPAASAAVAAGMGLLCIFVAASLAGDLPQLHASQTPGIVADASSPGGPASAPAVSGFGRPFAVGTALFSAQNVLTLELISILLIAAMVGVMVLAKGLRNQRPPSLSPESAGRDVE